MCVLDRQTDRQRQRRKSRASGWVFQNERGWRGTQRDCMRETGRQLVRQTETKTEKKEVTESVCVSERERVERDRVKVCESDR